MPLDAQLAALIEPYYGVTLEQLASGEVPPRKVHTRPVEGVDVTAAAIPGPHGDIAVRWYRPTATETTATLVWNHGGGWMGGDLDMPEADAVARRVAARLPATVVSVDYRLAPRHHYPVPLDDVRAAYDAVRSTAPGKIALGGASAGAHLAACAAVDAQPDALFLVYPATDPIHGPYPDARPPECPQSMWLDGPIVAGLFKMLMGGASGGVPAEMDLGGLPPTLVTTAGYDGLKPQAVRFVELLRAAGVDAQHQDEPGLLHGYLNMVGELDAADAALGRYVDWLRPRLA